MSHGPDERSQSWLVGSWVRPAVLTLLAAAAAFGVVYHHRDLRSVLAAAMCGAFVALVWCRWRRERRRHPPDPARRFDD